MDQEQQNEQLLYSIDNGTDLNSNSRDYCNRNDISNSQSDDEDDDYDDDDVENISQILAEEDDDNSQSNIFRSKYIPSRKTNTNLELHIQNFNGEKDQYAQQQHYKNENVLIESSEEDILNEDQLGKRGLSESQDIPLTEINRNENQDTQFDFKQQKIYITQIIGIKYEKKQQFYKVLWSNGSASIESLSVIQNQQNLIDEYNYQVGQHLNQVHISRINEREQIQVFARRKRKVCQEVKKKKASDINKKKYKMRKIEAEKLKIENGELPEDKQNKIVSRVGKKQLLRRKNKELLDLIGEGGENINEGILKTRTRKIDQKQYQQSNIKEEKDKENNSVQLENQENTDQIRFTHMLKSDSGILPFLESQEIKNQPEQDQVEFKEEEEPQPKQMINHTKQNQQIDDVKQEQLQKNENQQVNLSTVQKVQVNINKKGRKKQKIHWKKQLQLQKQVKLEEQKIEKFEQQTQTYDIHFQSEQQQELKEGVIEQKQETTSTKKSINKKVQKSKQNKLIKENTLCFRCKQILNQNENENKRVTRNQLTKITNMISNKQIDCQGEECILTDQKYDEYELELIINKNLFEFHGE